MLIVLLMLLMLLLLLLLLLLLMQMTMMRGQLLQGRRYLTCCCACVPHHVHSPSHAPAGQRTRRRVCGGAAVLWRRWLVSDLPSRPGEGFVQLPLPCSRREREGVIR